MQCKQFYSEICGLIEKRIQFWKQPSFNAQLLRRPGELLQRFNQPYALRHVIEQIASVVPFFRNLLGTTEVDFNIVGVVRGYQRVCPSQSIYFADGELEYHFVVSFALLKGY